MRGDSETGLAFSPLVQRIAADTAVDDPRMIAATVETVLLSSTMLAGREELMATKNTKDPE
jgi:hypothetical protein